VFDDSDDVGAFTSSLDVHLLAFLNFAVFIEESFESEIVSWDANIASSGAGTKFGKRHLWQVGNPPALNGMGLATRPKPIVQFPEAYSLAES
jgi:hypothetical protein